MSALSTKSLHIDQLTKDMQDIERAFVAIRSREHAALFLRVSAEVVGVATGLTLPVRPTFVWLLANLFRLDEDTRGTLYNLATHLRP